MIGKVLLLAAVAAVVEGAATRGAGGPPPLDVAACDPSGNQFLLLPHHEACDKFYICTHGQEVEMSCAGGTIFDYALQTCNWEWATQCWLRDAGSETESSPPESEESIGDGEEGSGSGDWEEPESRVAALQAGTHAQSDRAVVELNCAAAHVSTKLAPYRGDCQRYWRCNNGAAESAFCSDGLYFNARTLQCDFEANVPCARDADIVDEIGEEFLRY